MMRQGRSFSGNERNCCFLNTGASPLAENRFANISAVSGLDYPDDGRAVALVDWDHDGRLDMWVSNRNAPRLRLMRNEVPKGNHFLALRLEGNGTTTSRNAIGARVEVVLAGDGAKSPESGAGDSDESVPAGGHLPLIKTLRAGEGFLAQSSKWLHFGVGAANDIEKVIIHWPGGEVEQYTGIEVDHRYRLTQGSGTAEDVTMPVRESNLVRSTQEKQDVSQVARIPMVELTTVPESHYLGFDNRKYDLPVTSDRLLLVNLWASWCKPCLAELSEFTERYDELESAGIDILAISVEGLGGDATAVANAARLATARKFPFPAGLATTQLTSDLERLHNSQIKAQRQMSLPSSFLIDRQGRLAVIYKGPVSVDNLLQDVAHSEGSRQERFARSTTLEGRTIQHPQVEQAAINSGVVYRFQLAEHLQQEGRPDQAAKQYSDILTLMPDAFEAHYNLGAVLQEQGEFIEAAKHYQQALEIKPDYAIAHGNLGVILQRQGKLDVATEHYQKALQIKPDYAMAHSNLGVILQSQGKTNDAIGHFRQALQINPDYVSAHNNLGVALQRQEDFEGAVEHFRQVVRIKPTDAEAHNNLAGALSAQGDGLAAVEHFVRALHLKPKYPLALNGLAWIRATHEDAALRDGAEAIKLAKRCCELTGYRVVTPFETLAAAFAEAGQFDEAVQVAAKAIEMATAAGDDKAAQRIREQADLYKKGTPYREQSN